MGIALGAGIFGWTGNLILVSGTEYITEYSARVKHPST
jgi:hypothetical protein